MGRMSELDAQLKNAPAQSVKTQPQQLSVSERFTAKVLKEFSSNIAGELQITEYQKQLIQGYFITIDSVLKDNGIEWENVNMNVLATDIVHCAKLGLDMKQKNMLFAIPFKNGKTGKYDVNLMMGYNGIRYLAEKYAIDPPVNVTVELVYDTDEFHPIKKSASSKVESYEFEIRQPFNRGNIVGGFGYIEFSDNAKNKLVMMSVKEIEKRKPEKASLRFWGKDKWYEEMCLKTIKREIYSPKYIPIDPQKIDENYRYIKKRELEYAQSEIKAEIEEKGNKTMIDTTGQEIPQSEYSEYQDISEDPGTGQAVEGSDEYADPGFFQGADF